MRRLLFVTVLAILVGCGSAFSGSFGNGGEGGTTTSSTTTSSSSSGAGGSVVTGGSGGAIATGGSGGSISTGGSGGSPATIVLEWTFIDHPPNANIGIAGIVDFPAPTPDIDPIGDAVLLPSCLAPQTTDTVVSCDVGVAQPGTVLYIDLNSYPGGNFVYRHCDDPVVIGQANAKCEGTFTVSVGGTIIATCVGLAPLQPPCTFEVNPETGRRRYVIAIP